ncbi:hypothetical protein HD554DRAFT_838651 [Boletus coccyginus]|nr:hypothetical protein HD554DRAFT_838651 [Boletus coccyginus]
MPSLPLSNCSLCRNVRKRERCSSTRLATSVISARPEPLGGRGGANALRGPDDGRHGTSRVVTGGSAVPAFTAQRGGPDTGRDSCSGIFVPPKIDDPLRCCSATCGRAPTGREGERCPDDAGNSVAFDGWGLASRASLERMEPSTSELLLFSPATSGPGRLPFPFPFPFPFRGPPTTSFRSFRETVLGPNASARFWLGDCCGWYGCPVPVDVFRRSSSWERYKPPRILAGKNLSRSVRS